MPAQHRVGQVLSNGATVLSVDFREHPDGTTVEDVRDTRGNRSVQAIPVEGSAASNQQTLSARARAALVNNATFLAGVNADDHEQVQALTRQMDALIRIVLGLTETTVGT
jgi:hypothetical protein